MRWHHIPGARRTTSSRAAVTVTLALVAATTSLTPAYADTPGGKAVYSSGTSAPVTNDSPEQSDLPQLPDGYGPSGAQSDAMEAAAATARRTGKAVTVSSLTTPVQQVTASPGGGFRLSTNPQPVRTKQHGDWVAVDTTLHHNSDGTWSPAATAYGTVSFSGGGHAPLATTRYDGVSMAVSWPGTLPPPVIRAGSATYRSVLPSVDLVVSATAAGGFTDTLVVKSATAAQNPALATVRLGTQVKGGRLNRGSADDLELRDTHGRDLMDAASPLMWDSNTTLPKPGTKKARTATKARVAADPSDAAHPGLAAREASVGTKVSASGLSLVPDSRMLKARSTVFPVYIDPTFNWHPYDPAAPAFDEVKQGCPNKSFYNQTGSLADNGYLGVGYNGWQEGSCYTGKEHAIYQWKLSSTIFGAHINTATVNATEIYSASCSSSYTVNLHWSGGIGSGTDWSNRPGYNSYSTSAGYARAYNPTYCPSNGSVTHGLNVLTPIAHNAAGHSASFTATLSEDSAESGRDDGGFSRFSHNPSLEIFYNLPPSAPSKSTMAAVAGADDAACDTSGPDYPFMGKTIASTPPVLKAKVSDADGDKLQATFQYWVNGSTTLHTALSSDNLASGSYAAYSLPASFIGSLTSGQIVDWQVKVTDGEDSTAYTQSPTCHFVAEPTAPSAPTVTSKNNLYPNTDNGGGAGAAAGTIGTFNVTTSGGAGATKFVYSVDVPPATSNPPASQTVPATSNAAAVTITPYSPGPHTLWVYAVDAAGDDSGATGYPFLATGDPNSTTCTSLSACFNNTAISADTNPGQADIDGVGDSFSATDLTTAGWASGGRVTVNGATFTLPAFGSGQKDNILAANQTIPFSGSGGALAFLATSTYSGLSTPGAIANDDTAPYVPAGTPVSGTYCFNGTDPVDACAATGTITYTDGTTAKYDLTVPNWSVSNDAIAAVVLPHRNDVAGQAASPHRLFAFSVPIDPARTIASVTLPDVGNHIGYHTQSLHIFSMATRNTTTGTPEATGTTAAVPTGQSWTGAWANPNEGQYNFQGANFSNQTFRIALPASVSGNTVRIKLDNALGTSKLSIGHATIAQDSGSGAPSAVPAATPTTLTFGGSQSVTVPQGGSVYSDPLTFPVTANHYLLVSYQLSNSVPYLVQHSFANNAYQYVTVTGAGDKTTDTTGTPFDGSTGTLQGWFTDLVTNVDVTTSHTPTQAVLGDGLIDAFQPKTTPVASGSRVSDTLAGAEPTAPSPYGTIAEGIESNDLMTDNPQTYNGKALGGPSALSRIDRDILDQPGISNVVVYEGLEDLLGGSTPDDLEANGYTALVQQLQGWGISTTLASLTPCDGFAGDGATPNDPCTSTIDGNRTDVNDWLDDMDLGSPWSTPPVYYADFDTALAVPDTGNGENKLAAAADTGDHVNLTNSGYAAETLAILSPHDTWALDDGDGFTIANDTAPTDTPSTVNDTTGVGSNTLTLNGTTTWTDDTTRGETLAFDGTTGYAAGGQALNTAASYSVSAWVKLSSLPTRNATVASQDGTENSPFYLQYDYANTSSPHWALTFAGTDTTNPALTVAESATAATANTWTHLVGTYDATTKTAQLYVNGTLAATATGVTSWNAANAFTIGSSLYNGSNTDFFPGLISTVQAWNYALTPNQVTALHQQIP